MLAKRAIWLLGNQIARRKGGKAGSKLNQDKETYVKSTLQEFIFYLVFLLDLSILTFGMVNYNMYFFTNIMSKLFLESTSFINQINFKSITSMANFWEFAEGPLLESLYWREWYNGQPLHPGQSYIFYENILLGRPQIRQLRVRNNTCSVHENFKDLIKDCYDEYSFTTEDRSPFGLRTELEWQYRDPNLEFELWHWGRIGTYSNGGYIIELAKNKGDSAKMIKYLKSKLWLDHGSRAIFIDFSVYNANVNLFCTVRLLVEFPASGGAITSSEFYTVKLLRYVSKFDLFLAACEIIFCFFIFNYIIQEGIELHSHRFSYFKNFWNCLDFTIVLFSLLAIFYNIFRTIKVNLLLKQLLKNSDSYANFYFLAYWQNRYNIIIAFTVFIAWIKIFKYVSFNVTMTQLSTTLSRCANAIVGFAVMFFIVFFGYAQLGYLIFGTQVENFHTFGNCIFTQFRIILGDFNFSEIEEVNYILGPIYFITFVFCLFFVLLNVFLAIINDTYSEVKDDKALQKVDFDIYDVVKKSYNSLLTKLNLKNLRTKAHRSPGYKDGEGSQTALQYNFERNEDEELDLTESKKRIHHRQKISNQYYYTEPEQEAITPRNPIRKSDRRATTRENFLIMRTDQLEERMNDMSSKIDWIMEKLEKQTSVRSGNRAPSHIAKDVDPSLIIPEPSQPQ